LNNLTNDELIISIFFYIFELRHCYQLHARKRNIDPAFTLKLVLSFFSTFALNTEVCFLYVANIKELIGPDISDTNLAASAIYLAKSPTVIAGLFILAYCPNAGFPLLIG